MEDNFDSTTEIEPEFVYYDVNFLEECKEQRTLSGNSDEKLKTENIIEDNVDLGMLLFKGKIIRGFSQIISRNKRLDDIKNGHEISDEHSGATIPNLPLEHVECRKEYFVKQEKQKQKEKNVKDRK